MTAAGGSVGWHYADGRSGRLAYRVFGPRDAACLIFVHGVNMAGGVWIQVVDRLQDAFRCVVLDLRGHGMSTATGPFEVDDYRDDVEVVWNAVDAPRASLVGVSLGGMIACLQAQQTPDRVKSVIAFGSALRADHVDLDGSMARLRELGVAEFFAHSLPRTSLPPHASRDIRRTAAELASDRHADVETVEHITRAAFGTDLRSVLRPSGRPVLAVTGEHDTTCTPSAGREFAEAVGGSWRLVPGAGHILPLEDPGLSAHAIAGFVQGNDREEAQ